MKIAPIGASYNQMPMLDPLRRTVAHEDLFVERYDALVRAALTVTDGDRQAALDLVQDAFIRFTLVRPPLDDIERLDAYLYVMLRNMHTSWVRQRGRISDVSVSILDFDSLDIGLEALDVTGRLETRQTLRAACHYGCLRKHSSKVGSVFLLRFFHGYLPSEIARITHLSTAIVDELVFRARREVKVFVQHPEQRAFIAPNHPTRALAPPPAADASEEGLVRELRALMFSERHDRCWPKQKLRDLYGGNRAESLAREDLAALVGCPVCLDAVNSLLNVPKLANRWPTDTLGPGTRSGGAGGVSARLASGRRRARAVFEHRPRELRILANGFELGSHTIGAQPSELLLSANVSEPLALVELLTEQGLCLLFLDLHPPPDGSVRQRRRVELSDERHAELEVTFSGPWPTVRASYFDPRDENATLVDDALHDDRSTGRPAHAIEPVKPSWTTRVFGLRLAPAGILAGAVLIWLLFWTPGTQVSAAARIADTIKWLVSELWRSPPQPPRSETPALSPPIPSVPAPSPSIATARSSTPANALHVSAAQRTRLELRAIAQLQQVGAYLGQEISFGPRNAAIVDVRAAVDGQARKEVLLDALASLLREREVRVEIADLRVLAGRSRLHVREGRVPHVRDAASLPPSSVRVSAGTNTRRAGSRRRGAARLRREALRDSTPRVFAPRLSARVGIETP